MLRNGRAYVMAKKAVPSISSVAVNGVSRVHFREEQADVRCLGLQQLLY